MSAAKAVQEPGKKLDYRVPAGGPFSGAWKISAGVAVLGLLGAAAGFATNANRFAYSYLFAFVCVLVIALGAFFFVLGQHLTSAGWGVTVRRTAEFYMNGIWIFAILFLPILASKNHLFPWLAEHHGADHGAAHATHGAGHGDEHGAAPAGHVEHHAATPETAPHGAAAEHGAAHGAAAHGAVGPRWHGRFNADAAEHHEHGEIVARKKPYLNLTFFLIRAVIYFVAWTLLARRFFGLSTEQDKTRDPKNTVAMQRIAPASTFVYGLTLTFAAFDWIMSLNPTWYSTIFGVTYYASAVVSSLAIIIITSMAMREKGLVGDAINVEHYHDLGKLLFGFNVFWAYVNFSQFFLIWYAGIPEETTFFHHRWGNGPWKNVSLLLLFGHFVLPFVFLLSRNIKRKLTLLKLGSWWFLIMQVVESYWLILPNWQRATLNAYHPGVLEFHWMDIACLLFVGGAYLAVVFRSMASHPLIPVGDPRLPRSLHFENA